MTTKRNRVELELTPEQIKKLQPLQDMASENRMKGVIVGQAWPDIGVVVFKWFRFDELIRVLEITKETGGMPIPKRWVKKLFDRTAQS